MSIEETFDHPSVVVCPGGPILVRGAQTIEDAQGVLHPATRTVCAVCACGKSASQPWCDGTHKVIPDRS